MAVHDLGGAHRGEHIAQAYHDAPCTSPSCSGSPACKTSGPENMFGCDQHGVLGIREIGGPKARAALAAAQPAVYIVVRAAATHNDMPAHLEPFFAAKTAKPSRFACTSLMAQADITNYGF